LFFAHDSELDDLPQARWMEFAPGTQKVSALTIVNERIKNSDECDPIQPPKVIAKDFVKASDEIWPFRFDVTPKHGAFSISRGMPGGILLDGDWHKSLGCPNPSLPRSE
jgi:hypothetical protein